VKRVEDYVMLIGTVEGNLLLVHVNSASISLKWKESLCNMSISHIGLSSDKAKAVCSSKNREIIMVDLARNVLIGRAGISDIPVGAAWGPVASYVLAFGMISRKVFVIKPDGQLVREISIPFNPTSFLTINHDNGECEVIAAGAQGSVMKAVFCS
jgi:hypothetical protein